MPEIKVLPRAEKETRSKESEGFKGNPNDLTQVPLYYLALLHMFDASWLTVNDDDEYDANRLFVGGNLNLSLICALLFTTFLPLYYSEAQRLNDPNDGLTIDLSLGFLSPLVLSNSDLHDLFDTSYLIASVGTLFGTMVSAFFMLAANEANDDSKTFVLMYFLGPRLSQLPYYFFSIGIISWAFGAMVQAFSVPRTAAGFSVKIGLLWAMILFMMLVCFPRMIRGVFMGKLEAQRNPPIFVSEDQINNSLDSFFANPQTDGDLSLRAFLQSLTYLTEFQYRPKLQTITKIQAKLSAITGKSVSDVKEALDT